MRCMRTRLALLTIGLALLIPAIANASLSGEQHLGQNLIAQLHNGTKTCRDLSVNDRDHIGEYLMFRALGSTALHRAMNDRMIAMLGEHGETRMHQLLGARYAGCNTNRTTGGYGRTMGGGAMMGGYYNTSDGLAAMMNTSNWNWTTGGTWQHMSHRVWQRLQHRLLGTNINPNGHDGWSMTAIMATILGGLVLVALAIAALIRRPFRWPPTAPPSP